LAASSVQWGQPSLGFLGSSPFRDEDPRLSGLEFLGFPWIHSSESRLFNGLRGVQLKGFFSPAFVLSPDPGAGKPTIWRAKGTDCSWGKPNSISDFLQDISTRAQARD
jgi:hypothetical protein